MTTANLSVGLKTESAKQSLLELKAFMQREMKGVILGINDAALTGSVQAALKRQKFTLSFDASALRADVARAVGEAFATRQRIQLDTANLAEQVRAAVGAGTAGVKLQGTATAGGSIGPDLKVLLQQTLTPALDELAKAAALVGGTARQIGAGKVSGTATASSGYSYTNPDTGERVSFRRRLANPDQVLSGQILPGNEEVAEARRIKKEQDKRAVEAAREQANLFAALNAANNLELAQIKREEGEVERTQARLKRERFAALNAANNLELAQIKREEGQAERRAAQLQAERNRILNQLNNLELAAIRREQAEADLAAARTRRERFAALNAANNLELAQIRREEAAAERAAAKARSDAAKEARLQIARFYEDAKREAARTLTGPGAQVSAARQTASRFGTSATESFLGDKAGLLGVTDSLDKYQKGVTAARNSNVALRNSMNDAHSAARGLAGSLGVLWTTWGSTIPIVAAAAIGAAMRSVFTVGKDVEYQLEFVRVLSNGATVQIRDFGNAVRGSLTTPVEASQALRGLAQNGLSVGEALGALPAILNLATAGELGLTEAALGATGVMAAFGLQVTDLGRIGDVFAKAAALSNTSVQGMVESMKQASTVADNYKVTLEETAAGLAVLAQRNITGTAAGTAYRNMWVELATPTKRARDALESVGATLFDENKQLLESSRVLEILRGKISVLNEQSKLTFLNDVFGERGAKAANAILSNFDEYERTLKRIKEESKDFSQSVVNALGETTQGKLKSLFTEFQLSATTAFSQSSDSVKNFIDSMRQTVASERFMKDLAFLAESVVNLTRFLAENTQTVLLTIAAWKSIGWALAAAEAITSIGVAAKASQVSLVGLTAATKVAETSMVGLGVAARSVLGAATGAVGLIAILGIEFLLMSERTDKATESQRQFVNSLELETDRLIKATKASEDRTETLRRQVEYQRQGMSLSEAREKAEKDSAGAQVRDIQAQIDARKKHLADLQAQLAKTQKDASENKSFTMSGSIAKREEALRAEIKQVENEVYKLASARNAAEVNVRTKSLEDSAAFEGKRLEQIRAFNERVRVALNENGKLKIGQFRIDEGSAPTDEEGFKRFMAEREAGLNRNLVNRPQRDPEAEREANRLRKSEVRGLIDELRREEEQLKQNSRFARELAQAKYDTEEYGPYLSALINEQHVRQDLTKSYELEAKAVASLSLLKAQGVKESEKQDIDNEIARRTANIESMRRELQVRAQVDRFKAEAMERDRAARDEKMLTDLGVQDQKRLRNIDEKYLLKIIDPVDAARAAATLDVVNQYSKEIAERQDRLQRAERARARLADDLQNAAAEDVGIMIERVAAADEQIDRERTILKLLQDQSVAAQAQAGELAARNETMSRTAQYGLQKFWTDYRNAAESNAKAVYDVMRFTTDSMTDMVAKFVATGKLNFKEFARSVIAEAARVMASRAIVQLIGLAFNMFGPSAGGAGGGTAVNGSAGTGFGSSIPGGGTVLSANGNVMTAFGPMALKRFDKGGVGRSPMVSIFAEGKKPEAYVPLEDGRTIPVTVSGAAGGGSMHVETNVYVQSDGSTKVESQSSSQQAAALGKMIEGEVTRIIVREKRPGGILATA